MRQISYLPPRVKIHDNGNIEIIVDWCIEYGMYLLIIPKGFISDGNSVPWIFTRLVPKFGRNTLAGIVHDWLYKEAIARWYPPGDKNDKREIITRKFADQVRLDLCVKCSVSWHQRTLSYIALRLFGSSAWKAHRRREKDC